MAPLSEVSGKSLSARMQAQTPAKPQSELISSDVSGRELCAVWAWKAQKSRKLAAHTWAGPYILYMYIEYYIRRRLTSAIELNRKHNSNVSAAFVNVSLHTVFGFCLYFSGQPTTREIWFILAICFWLLICLSFDLGQTALQLEESECWSC